MSAIAPSRLEAFERVKQYQRHEKNTSEITTYIKGILESNFFSIARTQPDSEQAKRLNALWIKDRDELFLEEKDRDLWIEYFRSTFDHARLIPRLK